MAGFSGTSNEPPAVWINAASPLSEAALAPVLWGLEEEGIPARISETADRAADILGKEAADGSPLDVGIGFNGTARIVILHHRDLPLQSPLFRIGPDDFEIQPLRRLGINAARLVKRQALVFEKEAGIQDQGPGAIPSPSSLEDLIRRVIRELLQSP